MLLAFLALKNFDSQPKAAPPQSDLACVIARRWS